MSGQRELPIKKGERRRGKTMEKKLCTIQLNYHSKCKFKGWKTAEYKRKY